MQGKILRKLLNLPKSTPYWGILIELGMWTMKWRINNKKIMLLHKIMNRGEDNIVKKIISGQVRMNMENCWAEDVKITLNELNLEVGSLVILSSSEAKKKVKILINNKMYNEAINKIKSMKKLRFVNCNKEFEGNKNIIKLSVDDVSKFIKIKLNMLQLKENYKNKEVDTICRSCRETNETTEHLLSCKNIVTKYKEYIPNIENIKNNINIKEAIKYVEFAINELSVEKENYL